MIHDVPLAVLVVAADLRVLDANALAREIAATGDVLDGPTRAGLSDANAGVLASGDAALVQELAVTSSAGLRHETWWLGRIALADGASAVVALVSDVTDLVRARDSLASSERRARALFDTVDAGFCIIHVLLDGEGAPLDYRFLETNPAFERHAGLEAVRGRTIREMMPDIDAFWIDTYGRVAVTGEPARFVAEIPALGRWYDEHAFRVGAPHEHTVAVMFTDVTDRVRAQGALLASEARHAFLLELSDRLRPLAGAEEILDETITALGRHLGASRVGYAEARDDDRTVAVVRTYVDGVADLSGVYRYDDFGSALASALSAGRNVVRSDVAHDDTLTDAERAAHAALELGAVANVPLVKAGRLVAILFAHHRAAHDWTSHELDLMEAVAERTWAALERARAERVLHESEARYRTLFDTMDEGFCVLEVLFDEADVANDYRYLETNRAFTRHTGLRDALGKRVKELIPDIEQHWVDTYGRVARTGEGVRFVEHSPSMGRWFDVNAFRVGAPEDRTIAVLFKDITERMQAAEALSASEARNVYLVELNDAVRSLGDAGDIKEAACRVLGGRLRANRVLYFEIRDDTVIIERDFVDGVASLAGRRPIDVVAVSRLAAYRAGRSVMIPDIAADPNVSPDDPANYAGFNVRSLLVVPLLKDGEFVGGLVVHGVEPREWTTHEHELVEATAERTWSAIQRARAEAALRESEERYRLLTEALPEIVWSASADGATVRVNRRWNEYTGLEGSVGDDASLLTATVHPADLDRVGAAWRGATRAGGSELISYECRLRAADGTYRWFLVRGAAVRSSDGDVVQWVGATIDIDDQKRAEDVERQTRADLQHRVQHDALTGLPNRILFEDRLQQALAMAARHDRILAVLFIDLDGFKLVNDSHGHAAGDLVLQEIAARLGTSLRESDTLARLHGDEFAVLVSEIADPLDAGHLARTLLGEIARPVVVHAHVVTMGASIGVSVYPRDGTDPVTLVRSADAAMYRAKQSGKHDVRFFDATMPAPAEERAAVVEHLAGALERGELEVCYQPQWDSRTGTVVAFEALLRWTSPTLGEVPPERFVTVAEARGAFGTIVAWSLDTACATIRGLSDELGAPLRVALNVSTARVLRPGFIRRVVSATERHALQPHQFELELELRSAWSLDGSDALQRVLDELRDAGVRLTLDRFGADAALVAPFLDLPFHGVKLDGSLVRRAALDTRFRHGLHAVVGLVHDLGLELSAGTVETEAQRDVLVELGFARLQGYLFGRPMPVEEAAAVIRRQHAATLF